MSDVQLDLLDWNIQNQASETHINIVTLHSNNNDNQDNHEHGTVTETDQSTTEIPVEDNKVLSSTSMFTIITTPKKTSKIINR